jgi:hypothetical protein
LKAGTAIITEASLGTELQAALLGRLGPELQACPGHEPVVEFFPVGSYFEP